ncbi:MAG: DUF2069 domain-containing protein [Pseudomonadota bacterium]
MINLSWCKWSLLGLLILQPLWFVLLSPPEAFPLYFVLLVTIVPLLLVFPGSWKLKPRSLVIAGTLLMAYFCIGVMEAWTHVDDLLPGTLQALLCVTFFMGLATIRREKASSD